jgi:hypothetical protein
MTLLATGKQISRRKQLIYPLLAHQRLRSQDISGKILQRCRHYHGGAQMHTDFRNLLQWHGIIYVFQVSLSTSRGGGSNYLTILYLCIGTSVAVERVFSAGRDVISVRRASLSAESIRMLMNYRAGIILEKRIGRRFDS